MPEGKTDVQLVGELPHSFLIRLKRSDFNFKILMNPSQTRTKQEKLQACLKSLLSVQASGALYDKTIPETL